MDKDAVTVNVVCGDDTVTIEIVPDKTARLKRFSMDKETGKVVLEYAERKK